MRPTMKAKMLSVASAVLASGFAVLLSYVLGARGETLGIIAGVTLLVSCSTAFAAATVGLSLREKRHTLGAK